MKEAAGMTRPGQLYGVYGVLAGNPTRELSSPNRGGLMPLPVNVNAIPEPEGRRGGAIIRK